MFDRLQPGDKLVMQFHRNHPPAGSQLPAFMQNTAGAVSPVGISQAQPTGQGGLPPDTAMPGMGAGNPVGVGQAVPPTSSFLPGDRFSPAMPPGGGVMDPGAGGDPSGDPRLRAALLAAMKARMSGGQV